MYVMEINYHIMYGTVSFQNNFKGVLWVSTVYQFKTEVIDVESNTGWGYTIWFSKITNAKLILKAGCSFSNCDLIPIQKSTGNGCHLAVLYTCLTLFSRCLRLLWKVFVVSPLATTRLARLTVCNRYRQGAIKEKHCYTSHLTRSTALWHYIHTAITSYIILLGITYFLLISFLHKSKQEMQI